jgi:hypothetical protein
MCHVEDILSRRTAAEVSQYHRTNTATEQPSVDRRASLLGVFVALPSI